MQSLCRYGQHQLIFLNGLGLMFASGITLADNCGLVSLSLLAALGGLSVFIFALSGVLALRVSQFFSVPMVVLFFLMGFLRYELALREPDYSDLAGEQVSVAGVVEETPELGVVNGKQRRRFILRVENIGHGTPGGNLYVSESLHREAQGFKPLDIGDRVQVIGRLRAIRGYGNPGRIDTVRQAKAKEITGRITALKMLISPQSDDELSLWLKLRRQLARMREHYYQGMGETMAPRDRAAVMAMLFGGYAELDPGLVESFTLTGIVHILSVSGSHMALLAGIVLWLGGMLRLRRRVIFALLTGVVLLYSLLSGLIPPVVRSGLMAIAAFGAFVWGRGDSRDGGRLLVILAVALLVYQPRWLYDISFQLSFLATAGLIYIAPAATAFLTERGVPRWLAMGLAVTFGANISTLPIIAWYFNQFSLSSFAANLLIVPLVDFIIAVTLLGGMVGIVLPLLMKLTFVTAGLTMGAVRELSALLAGLPFGSIYLPSLSLPMTIGYYSLLCLLLWKKSRSFMAGAILQGLDRAGRYIPRQRLLPAALGVVLSGAGLLWVFSPEKNIISVHFIDVGQGDAALIVTPRGKGVMIDCGGTRDNAYDVGGRVVVPYLLHHGVRELETIYLTHAHEDHAAGAASILKKLPVKAVITGNEDRKDYEKSLGLPVGDEAWSKFYTAKQGEVRQIDGVKFEVIYAPQERGKDNEASIIVKATYKQASFLFTGDLTGDRERAVLKTAEPKCTVLKVAHHGSKTSSTAEFLRASSPACALISVSADNTFGHPANEVLKRLSSSGAKIYRTDRDGAVTFYTDGENMHIKTFNEKD